MIEEEVQAREGSTTCAIHESRRPKEFPTDATLFVDTASPQCCFCGQGHSLQDCRTVVGVESRREALQKTGRCYICLGRDHMSCNCRSRIKCLSYKGRHHVAICPSKCNSRPEKSNPSSGSEITATLNPEATPYNPPATPTLWTYSGKHVLLQTAQATVFNPDCPSKTHTVRIMMDTGSQQSYITDRAQEQLALATSGEQCMTIMTFGATQGGS